MFFNFRNKPTPPDAQLVEYMNKVPEVLFIQAGMPREKFLEDGKLRHQFMDLWVRARRRYEDPEADINNNYPGHAALSKGFEETFELCSGQKFHFRPDCEELLIHGYPGKEEDITAVKLQFVPNASTRAKMAQELNAYILSGRSESLNDIVHLFFEDHKHEYGSVRQIQKNAVWVGRG